MTITLYVPVVESGYAGGCLARHNCKMMFGRIKHVSKWCQKDSAHMRMHVAVCEGLARNHSPSESQKNGSLSRFMRVILAQGPC